MEGGASRGACIVSFGGGDDGCRRPPQADENFTSFYDRGYRTTFVRYFFKEITAKINQGNSHMLLHPTRSELITHTNIYGHVVQSSKTTDPTTIITTIFFFWWDTLVVVFISFSDGIATYKDVQAHAPR